MLHITDVKPHRSGRNPRLGMAPEAEVRVADSEQLRVDRTMRVVTSRATFAQGWMFKDEWPGLLPVALSAGFVLPRHSQASRWFHDVRAVRVMALDAIHLAFGYRMMLRKMELCVHVQVALVTSRRILTWIHDELVAARASDRDMLARRPVAGFAAILLAGCLAVLEPHPRMRTRRK